MSPTPPLARRDGAPGGFVLFLRNLLLSRELLAKPTNLSVRTVRGLKNKT